MSKDHEWRKLLTRDELVALRVIEGQKDWFREKMQYWSAQYRTLYMRAKKREGRKQKVVDKG